jgi:endoglucanase
MEIIPLLKKLSEAAGLSGYEHAIRDQVAEIWSPLVDQVKTDTLGNLIALKQGSGPEPRCKLMLASHMDEIGLMVTQVKGAFLSITRVGGVDQRLLLGQPVLVHGREDLPGVIGSRPPHLLKKEERDKLVSWDDLVVDVGLPADRVSELVRVGDLISFRQDLTELGSGGRVVGKALDNRASVVAIAVCLDLLQSRLHQWDLLAVATVQEEVTLGGVITSTYGVEPDVGIAIDVTFATGPGVSEADAFPLGKGPAIGFGPNVHPGVYQALIDAAKAIEMAFKIEPMPRMSGTDAIGMQVSRSGVPTGVVSIPLRNMHMPVEVAAVKDIERVGRLLAEFAMRLDEDFVAEKLAWDQDEEE